MSGGPLPRGTVTFLFSDIEESTEIVRSVGDEAFAAIRVDHRRLMREAFAAHGGREIDTAGDGFFVAFDSARSAASAAVEAQRALAAAEWPAGADVRVRMGLHTAEPFLGEDGYVGVGVHRAARICDAARGGQILVSNATAGVVEDAELPGVELVDLGEHRLKGLPREQRLFQLTVDGLPSEFGVPRTPAAAGRRPGIGTFVGTDLRGWRDIVQAFGDEAVDALQSGYFATVTAAVEANAGVVLERMGDETLAVFDNAADAARAAIGIREAIADFAWPPGVDVGVSIAVHSGRWSGDPRRPTASTALVRLARLSSIVEPGQIVVSQATAGLLEGDDSIPMLRDLGEREIPQLGPTRIHEVAG